MMIELGKRYLTRSGSVIGPLTKSPPLYQDTWPYAAYRPDTGAIVTFLPDGRVADWNEDRHDIVAEFSAPVVNDYKQDQGKPPMLEALLPFYPALRALAAMMNDMKAKHKLEGAKDPFNEWRQLPNAKARLMNAAGGHLLQGPWKINEKDGNHLHAVHALFGLLAGITIHVEETK